jgi:ADP-ribose pyrophosphatase YjhB (NUDIX family)
VAMSMVKNEVEIKKASFAFWDNPDLMPNLAEQNEIIQVHCFTKFYRVVLFKRSDGPWAPISGKVEIGESYASAARREIHEEVGLRIDLDQIIVSDHSFSSVSPKGKTIFGTTCFTVIPDFISQFFRFNNELIDSKTLVSEDALDLLARKGMPEAFEGLFFLFSGMPHMTP